jgi:hypothetical protein
LIRLKKHGYYFYNYKKNILSTPPHNNDPLQVTNLGNLRVRISYQRFQIKKKIHSYRLFSACILNVQVRYFILFYQCPWYDPVPINTGELLCTPKIHSGVEPDSNVQCVPSTHQVRFHLYSIEFVNGWLILFLSIINLL